MSLANDFDDFHSSWVRSVPVSGLPSPTQFFSYHSILSETPKASRGKIWCDLNPTEHSEGVEAYQQGYM